MADRSDARSDRMDPRALTLGTPGSQKILTTS